MTTATATSPSANGSREPAGDAPAQNAPQVAGQAPGPQAFDLIIEGVGYLNRVRTVKPAKGPAYDVCTVNAMMGTADAVDYVSIDCRIVGRQALEAVRQLKPDADAKRKVIVGFRAGDPRPDFYEFPDRTTGDMRQGQGLKARLLQLTFAKVDGRKVDIPLVQRLAERQSADAEHAHGAAPASATFDATDASAGTAAANA